MNTRKLISFGKNSFVVSLPKSWIQRNNLSKGDEISFEETFDMLILSTQNNKFEQETRIKRITAEESSLKGDIISAYVNNYDIIEIKGENLNKYFDLIRDTTHNMVAFEVMELGPKKVVIKDFLNTSDISLDNILKRIDMIIRAMITEIRERDEDMNLENRDKDINRLFFVANKLMNKVLIEPKLAKELQIPIKGVLMKWRVLTALESIGDQLKRLGRIFHDFHNEKEKKKFLELFIKISDEYHIIIKSLYNLDKNAAAKMLSRRKEMLSLCDTMLDLLDHECKNPHHVLNVAFSAEKLKRLHTNISHIARAVVNAE